jgi:transcriptional regulator with XRE-family HTH domain
VDLRQSRVDGFFLFCKRHGMVRQKIQRGADMITLGQKIKQLRNEKGLSQSDLEKRSGVSSKLLSKYENGRIMPTADTLKKIAEGLDISADYLIFDNVPKDGRCQLNDLQLFERFKEVERMPDEEKLIIMHLIDAVIVKTRVEQAVKIAKNQTWERQMRQTVDKLRKRAEGYSEQQIMQIVDEAVEAVRFEENKAD